MGVFIKRRQGVEYLYLLAGKSQYFLGRRDDLDNLNMQNLCKAVKIIDKNFDRAFAKYVKDMQEHARYMPKKERVRYVANRLERLGSMLDQLSGMVKDRRVA